MGTTRSARVVVVVRWQLHGNVGQGSGVAGMVDITAHEAGDARTEAARTEASNISSCEREGATTTKLSELHTQRSAGEPGRQSAVLMLGAGGVAYTIDTPVVNVAESDGHVCLRFYIRKVCK